MTTKTRDLSDLLDANGDVKASALDNVPDSTNASALSSGTVAPARLGSGTASSTTFLAGDSTFKTVSGTTINNNANNRVITGSDSSNTLEGEANLTFDGTHLNLGDNQNIQIGASNDLQLFHNASDSFVQDAGTGVLKLRGNSKVEINQYSDDEKMAVFNIDGAAELYHNGVKKIETASGGVNVTGAVRLQNATTGSGSGDGLLLEVSGNDVYFNQKENADIYFRTNNTDRLKIENDGVIKIGSGVAENTSVVFDGNAQDYYIGIEDSSDRLRIGAGSTVGNGSGIGITSTGVTQIINGLAIGGTGTANTLDDYEEGTFTPEILNGWGILNPSYSTQSGYYTKIGNLVTVSFKIILNGGSTNGNKLTIQNFPFTGSISTNTVDTINGFFDTASSNAENVFLKVLGNAPYPAFFTRTSSGTAEFTGTHSGNSANFQFSGSYYTT